jgi:hypothetical protein
MPLTTGGAPTAPPQFARLPAEAVSKVIADDKARIAEVAERAGPPDDLPPALEALQAVGYDKATGPEEAGPRTGPQATRLRLSG